MYKYLNSKTLLAGSIATAVVYVSRFFLSLENDARFVLFDIVLSGLFLGWMVLMLSVSNLRDTYYWNIIQLSFAVSLVGVLFRIQHWEGYSLFMLVGVCGIMITYLLRFINKTRKTMLDALKLSLVLSYCGYYYMHQMHWLQPIYALVYPAVFLVTIIEFARRYDKLVFRMAGR